MNRSYKLCKFPSIDNNIDGLSSSNDVTDWLICGSRLLTQSGYYDAIAGHI